MKAKNDSGHISIHNYPSGEMDIGDDCGWAGRLGYLARITKARIMIFNSGHPRAVYSKLVAPSVRASSPSLPTQLEERDGERRSVKKMVIAFQPSNCH
jgi:hypothetical protein